MPLFLTIYGKILKGNLKRLSTPQTFAMVIGIYGECASAPNARVTSLHASDVYPTNLIRVLKSAGTFQKFWRQNYLRATAPLNHHDGSDCASAAV